jgi:hypothetical protein
MHFLQSDFDVVANINLVHSDSAFVILVKNGELIHEHCHVFRALRRKQNPTKMASVEFWNNSVIDCETVQNIKFRHIEAFDCSLCKTPSKERMFFITFTEYSFAHYKTLVISGG